MFVDEEALLSIDASGTGIGDVGGDEGADVVARKRSWEMMASKFSSKGKNSSWKKGCEAIVLFGEGEPIYIGSELLVLRKRKPSDSKSCTTKKEAITYNGIQRIKVVIFFSTSHRYCQYALDGQFLLV